MSTKEPVNPPIDQFLAANKYEVDESHAHIQLVDKPDPLVFGRLVRVCPAALYRRDDSGQPTFDYAGCLECGTCRIAGSQVLQTWEFPQPTMGVEYRYG